MKHTGKIKRALLGYVLWRVFWAMGAVSFFAVEPRAYDGGQEIRDDISVQPGR